MTDEQTDIATNCRILLFDVIQSLRHLPVLGLREHDGEGPGGDPHHGKDEGGDGGVDVSQGGHSGGQRPAHLEHYHFVFRFYFIRYTLDTSEEEPTPAARTVVGISSPDVIKTSKH